MIFVAGANGQLGYEICKVLESLNEDYYPITRKDFNLVNTKEIYNFFINKQPSVIIHCAAYTNVDLAEENKELCYAVNTSGTKSLIDISKKIGCKFVYISTDYVFSGEKSYAYEVYDKVEPINYYGYTKAEGEKYLINNYHNSYIIRVSSVYGINGNNFVKSMINISKKSNEVNVVYDQISSQSYAKDLAYGIINIINIGKPGIYHLTNEGYLSFYDFAIKIFEKLNINIKVNKILSKDYKSKAKRGLNLMLSKKCLKENNIPFLPTIEEGLLKFINEMRL